jgi:protein-S-isoprenylcysteine O-methyltransferase Ste14
MAKIIGRFTINPFFFVTGKVSGYICWLVLFLSLIGFYQGQISSLTKYSSYVMLAFAMTLIVISLFNLGDSTSLGLPGEKTSLKIGGLYGLSRNPMYLGFDMLTLASMLYTLNIFIVILGLYSIIIYHFIIIGEEKFLRERFGKSYSDYFKKVRRYM